MSDQDPHPKILAAAKALAPLASDPPPQHWLCSDATYSYCWPCARMARWLEMDRMGPPPPEADWFRRSDAEREIVEGIDGGDWCSGISDTPQACERCGCTLKFRLTPYGVSYTMEGFEPENISAENLRNPDTVYELREMLEQGAWTEDEEERAALVAIAKTVIKLVPKALATGAGGLTT